MALNNLWHPPPTQTRTVLQVKDMETTISKLETSLKAETDKAESATQAKAKLEVEKADVLKKHGVDIDAQRQYFEGLLQKARSAQVCSSYRYGCSISFLLI